jgi:light-regulated signal transduction histidine kinase (bacteriophytochrome)
VSEIARNVVHELGLRDPQHRVNMDIQNDLVAYADDHLLRILLDNLLGNAWKFTAKRANPTITLGAQRHNGSTVYYVRDNGAGFNMVYVSKLFRPFQRLHDKEEFQGTGIGLATAQRVVDRHGGRIWAEAEENVGATFYFTL